MGMVAPLTRLASAFYVLFGRRGDVSRHAAACGVPRQTVYREAGRAAAAVAGDEHAAELARWRERADDLRRELDALRAERARREPLTVTIDPDKQAHFAAVAQAEGVSLPVARRLLAVLLGAAAPSVARLGRYAQAAGRRAAELLPALDAASRPLVRQAALDEVFVGRKPVLMAVEPESLAWVAGRLAPARDGAEWARELGELPALEQATADQARGLRRGLARANAARRAAGLPEAAFQADHFHLLRAAARALRGYKRAAARALRAAERRQGRWDRHRRAGRPGIAKGQAAAHGWKAAEAAFDRWGAAEAAWRRLRDGLGLFTPAGELNSRGRVQALLAEVEPHLAGPAWAKVHRLLARPEALTFLDRAHARLAALPVAPAARQAALDAEGRRRRPECLAGEGKAAAAARGVLLACGVVLGRLGAAGAEAAAAVRGVLRDSWRASSPVEGVNGVLRMHQARQRRLTQPLLDLKRLYWNCRALRTGRRRGRSPYERLGVRLPAVSWWELLRRPAEQLRQELSAPPVAA